MKTTPCVSVGENTWAEVRFYNASQHFLSLPFPHKRGMLCLHLALADGDQRFYKG